MADHSSSACWYKMINFYYLLVCWQKAPPLRPNADIYKLWTSTKCILYGRGPHRHLVVGNHTQNFSVFFMFNKQVYWLSLRYYLCKLWFKSGHDPLLCYISHYLMCTICALMKTRNHKQSNNQDRKLMVVFEFVNVSHIIISNSEFPYICG